MGFHTTFHLLTCSLPHSTSCSACCTSWFGKYNNTNTNLAYAEFKFKKHEYNERKPLTGRQDGRSGEAGHGDGWRPFGSIQRVCFHRVGSRPPGSTSCYSKTQQPALSPTGEHHFLFRETSYSHSTPLNVCVPVAKVYI